MNINRLSSLNSWSWAIQYNFLFSVLHFAKHSLNSRMVPEPFGHGCPLSLVFSIHWCTTSNSSAASRRSYRPSQQSTASASNSPRSDELSLLACPSSSCCKSLQPWWLHSWYVSTTTCTSCHQWGKSSISQLDPFRSVPFTLALELNHSINAWSCSKLSYLSWDLFHCF